MAAAEREYGKLYGVAKAVMTPVFGFCWRIKVEGLEHLPVDGPAILCPNHTSVIDSFILPSVLPRRITFVGKAEYMDSWKTKYLFPAMGMIPIDRGGGSASERALTAAARVLERGELFGIYPEGTRSRDGVLHKGHTGPARLALRTGAPLIPVGLRGTRDIQPPEAKFPKMFMPAEVRFGKPISVERYHDRPDDRMVLRQLIDEVMFEIRNLSGQEYVDTYATKKAESLPTETAHVPSSNGHVEPLVDVTEAGEKPRRSSADVLNRS
jgi:1-acyl-sn-glycerol-3-phosphate acyltransferase